VSRIPLLLRALADEFEALFPPAAPPLPPPVDAPADGTPTEDAQTRRRRQASLKTPWPTTPTRFRPAAT
jgi:hypothetical protein